jgi:hypothetical protein
VTWLLKHSTLKKLGATSLTNTQIETLCLPNKVENVCGNNVPQHIKEIRLNKKFDNFRSSRFPDNVRTLLEHDNKDDSDIPMTGEFIWVRLYAAISETEFEGKLLNQPMVGSLSMGEKVLVKMENKENGEVLTCQKQESRMVKIDSTFFNSEFKNDLLDKATGAPTLFRLVFEVLERRLSQEFPQLLLAPHWDAFIGVGTVAGCQLISMHLHHEIPAEFRTELEMKIKGSLELGYPKSAPFWEDSSRFFRDNLLDIPRPDRSRIAFRIQSEWIILHVTGGKELEKQHEIILRLAGYLKHEVPGYWSSIQDHSGN